MWNLFGRGIWVLGGFFLLFEALSPLREEMVTVGPHPQVNQQWRESRPEGERLSVEFSGGEVRRCSMLKLKALSLRDGEQVLVRSLRLSGRCVGVVRDGEQIFHVNSRLYFGLGGCFLIGTVFLGWPMLRRRVEVEI